MPNDTSMDWSPDNHSPRLTCRIVNSLDEVEPAAWNDLTQSHFPFLRHEFLYALEKTDCLNESSGWNATHLIIEDERRALVAAAPMYLKFNSFGEFVFDWSWADAFHRNGLNYYPKLVIASPFTPATGPRILMAQAYRKPTLRQRAIDSAIETAKKLNVSSLHVLFSDDPKDFETPDLMPRIGYQFHWENKGYSSFGDFLDRLTAKKRKLIKRERRRVIESGIVLRRIPGNEVTEQQWSTFYEHYRSTFISHGNFPALNLEFFIETARSMGGQTMLVAAYQGQRMLASAYFLVGESALYGRYWGCSEEIPGLHFEACYYQGIEYCIECKLKRFEPGAQGEHKISRGFLPTPTWSGHWIRDHRFKTAIENFLCRERPHIEQHIEELHQHSPYRET